MKLYNKSGFTLLEIMVVVAIIALVLAIAIPNYHQTTLTAKRTVCIDNLKKITAAIEQWATDNSIQSGTAITSQQTDDVYSNYFRTGKPVCPSGGQYTMNPVGASPQAQCTKEDEGHKL
jgi:prepilin-type N-terminal cleavage/methylation domain-containing protein